MATRVKEIQQGLRLPACDPQRGGCCSVHRRADRVYEDQLWALAKRLGTGHQVHEPACP